MGLGVRDKEMRKGKETRKRVRQGERRQGGAGSDSPDRRGDGDSSVSSLTWLRLVQSQSSSSISSRGAL
ncbi:hypothetical protein NQZ68_028551 [Dissostichus eleginoides]|nr:hypothetical protein NQZ68_028551 [Dissostichus eleginoides]